MSEFKNFLDRAKLLKENESFLQKMSPDEARNTIDLLMAGVAPDQIQPLRGTKPGTIAEDTIVDLIEKTTPLRDQLIGRAEDFLSSGDVTQTPAFDVARQAADRQFQNARDSILTNLPSGGVLLDKLADLDIAKARDLSVAEAGIFDSELNRAFSLATGAPLQTGLSMLNQRAAQQTQLDAAREAAEANRDAAGKGAAGTGIGLALGGK